MKNKSIFVLEESHAIEIMLALPDKGQMRFMELVKICGGSVSMISLRIAQLKEAGLVDDVVIKAFPKKRLVSLTDLGREVSVCLELIDNALSGAKEEAR